MGLNPTLSLNDLERTKFKDGATQSESIVQVCPTQAAPGSVITSPESRIISFATAGVEQEIVFPADVVAISVMNQTTNATYNASWQLGETSSNYFTIKPGQTYSEKNILSISSLSLYVSSSRNGTILSIVQWT